MYLFVNLYVVGRVRAHPPIKTRWSRLSLPLHEKHHNDWICSESSWHAHHICDQAHGCSFDLRIRNSIPCWVRCLACHSREFRWHRSRLFRGRFVNFLQCSRLSIIKSVNWNQEELKAHLCRTECETATELGLVLWTTDASKLLRPFESWHREHLCHCNLLNAYQSWILLSSDLPYEVSTAEAMKHDEVKKRVEDSINQLRTVTEAFMAAILGSIEEIPWDHVHCYTISGKKVD